MTNPPDGALRELALGTLLASFTGPTPPTWACDLLRDGLAGYVLFGYNVVDPPQLGRLVESLREHRADVVIGIDEEGGDVTRLAHAQGSPYPGNAALGAADDPDLTRAVYRAIGTELAELGINLNLAPTVDVNVADENPIIGTRSFGVDPARVAAHTAAAVTGLQEAGVAACAKHFPGHGATVVDSHLELPVVDVPPQVLWERELPPFKAAIAAGTRAIMSAHIRVPVLTGDDPATLSPAALTTLLRQELGFTGVVITDALEMKGASASLGIAEAAVRALAAGADLLCLGARVDAALVESVVTAIVAALRQGRLEVARLEEAVARNASLGGIPRPSDTAGARDASGASLGLEAARRALRMEGDLPPLRSPFIVQLESPATIAAGEVPWGLAAHLRAAGATQQVLRVGPDHVVDPDGFATDLATRAAGQEIVVVARDIRRYPWARSLVERLTVHHPTVVLVEMGWPTAWRPTGLRAYVTTYGAAQANARAAAEALLATG